MNASATVLGVLHSVRFLGERLGNVPSHVGPSAPSSKRADAARRLVVAPPTAGVEHPVICRVEGGSPVRQQVAARRVAQRVRRAMQLAASIDPGFANTGHRGPLITLPVSMPHGHTIAGKSSLDPSKGRALLAHRIGGSPSARSRWRAATRGSAFVRASSREEPPGGRERSCICRRAGSRRA